MLNGAQVAKHRTRESCWVIIRGNAYDVTDFLDVHPGGASVVLKYGGKVIIWNAQVKSTAPNSASSFY
jgi:L-lactate dehydrogenase (cytochrome)